MPKYCSRALPMTQEALRSISTACWRSLAASSGVVTKLIVTVFFLMHRILPDYNGYYLVLTNNIS